MKQYNEKQELTAIVCNRCKKKIPLDKGILKHGVFSAAAAWGYFSEKDGEVHAWDLCEECYDEIVKEFAIPPQIEEATEFV